MISLLIIMITIYLLGVLVGLFTIIYSFAGNNYSRSVTLFIYLCVLTGTTLILSLPALHMHGPKPNLIAVGIAWVVNSSILLFYILYAIKRVSKSYSDNHR